MVTRITATKLGDMFDEVVSQRGNATYLIFKDQKYSYDFMHNLTNRIAKSLLKMGVKEGDHVGIWMMNRPEWICISLACYKIGAVVVTMNTLYQAGELEYLFQQSDATTILFNKSFRSSNYYERLMRMIPELNDCQPCQLHSEKFPYLKNIIGLDMDENKAQGILAWEDMLKLGEDISDQELASVQEQIRNDTPAVIIYTSGTTGHPKGVMISQKAIMQRERTYNEWFRMTSDDVVWCASGLFYNFGCITGCLGTIRAGATLVLMETFNAREALRLIETYRCTIINMISVHAIMMLSEMDSSDRIYDLSCCRSGIMGGSPMPVVQVQKTIDRLVPHICSAWGMTECSTNGTITRWGDPAELVSTTVGVSLPDNEVLIFDPETDEALPPGIQGEIRIRSDANMLGYYKMPEATKAAFDKKGFMHTGDLGVLLENGYFQVTGRMFDTFITGGQNAYPSEIENYICRHPAVHHVEVVGVPDPRLNEVAMAFIQLKEGKTATEEDIISYCKKGLAGFKVPRYVRFVTEYPLTVSGKILKRELREIGRKELGYQDIFEESNKKQ